MVLAIGFASMETAVGFASTAAFLSCQLFNAWLILPDLVAPCTRPTASAWSTGFYNIQYSYVHLAIEGASYSSTCDLTSETGCSASCLCRESRVIQYSTRTGRAGQVKEDKTVSLRTTTKLCEVEILRIDRETYPKGKKRKIKSTTFVAFLPLAVVLKLSEKINIYKQTVFKIK